MTPREAKLAIMTALGKRCALPEWVLLEEVCDSTGWSRARNSYADAVAMNCYPSRGLEVHGFEVKVSRSDFLRELKDPEKNASIQQYCDRWWIVVSELALVKAGELPPTWGLLVLEGKRLRQEIEAPVLKAVPLDRLFVASLLRRFAQKAEGAEKSKRSYQRGQADGREEAKQELEIEWGREKRGHEELKGVVQRFEEASGVTIAKSSWDAGRVGEAVKRVLAGDRAVMETEIKVQACIDKLGRQMANLETMKKELSFGQETDHGTAAEARVHG